MDNARAVVIIFFIGLAAMFGSILLIYIVMVLCDLAAPPTELSSTATNVPWTERVALSMADRQRVLRALFLSSTFVFREEKEAADGEKEIELGTTRSSSASANDDIEQEAIPDCANNTVKTSGDKPLILQRRFSKPQPVSEDNLTIDDGQHNSLCCICLEPYRRGEQILHSKHCEHQFHARCVQDWLLNRHECPYCRKEMIQRDEWEETVAAVLGDQSTVVDDDMETTSV